MKTDKLSQEKQLNGLIEQYRLTQRNLRLAGRNVALITDLQWQAMSILLQYTMIKRYLSTDVSKREIESLMAPIWR